MWLVKLQSKDKVTYGSNQVIVFQPPSHAQTTRARMERRVVMAVTGPVVAVSPDGLEWTAMSVREKICVE